MIGNKFAIPSSHEEISISCSADSLVRLWFNSSNCLIPPSFRGKPPVFLRYSSFQTFCMESLVSVPIPSRIHFLHANVPSALAYLEISNKRDFIETSPCSNVWCATFPFSVLTWKRHLWQRASIERVKICRSIMRFPRLSTFTEFQSKITKYSYQWYGLKRP